MGPPSHARFTDEDIRKVGEREHEKQTWVLPSLAYTVLPPGHEGFPENCLPTKVAVQFCEDLLSTDQSPRLNLATFVTTHMEKDAHAIIDKAININLADAIQYPSCLTMNNRCVKMLADLYHSPAVDKPCGTSTVGCTEATLMAGLAMKRMWQHRRREQKKSTENPNLIVASTAQVCWTKFCSFFEVEPRFLPIEEDERTLSPQKTKDAIDENTIGVVAILGSTYTGEMDDVAALDAVIEEVNQREGWGVQLTIDAALGGFVIPFLEPELAWDFRLKNVVSISVSGHKFGGVYPGVGWVIWRSEDFLPKDLVQTVSYLGKPQSSMTINFSRNAMQVALQYYNFIRLGREGYKILLETQMRTALFLADELEKTGHFQMISEPRLPIVAFRLTQVKDKDGKERPRVYDEYDVMWRIREFRWMLPAYSFPDNAKAMKLLRAVIRHDITREMVEGLVTHIKEVMEWLDAHYADMDPQQMKDLKDKFQTQDPNADIGL